MNFYTVLFSSAIVLGSLSLASSDTFAGKPKELETGRSVSPKKPSIKPLTLMGAGELKPVSLASTQKLQRPALEASSSVDEEVPPSIAASIAASEDFPVRQRIALLSFIPAKFPIRGDIAMSIASNTKIDLELREMAWAFLPEGPEKKTLSVQLMEQREEDETSDSEDESSDVE